jgi:hypothetical protein
LVHLSTSSELNEPFMVSSANSMPFPSFHRLHACRIKTWPSYFEVIPQNIACMCWMRYVLTCPRRFRWFE